MSIDRFYELVTGEKDSFFDMCMALPDMIKAILEEVDALTVPKDTVLSELKANATDSFELALFMLGFETYLGFDRLR